LAVPARVIEVDERRELALCQDTGGAHTTVEVALVGPVAPGDLLLVHAGTAIARAQETPA
jgi:hydrogenase assembly chaperone HypC/HupF